MSFISLRTVAASLLAVCEPGADLVVLVKPQFEAEHAIVSRGNGIVTDPAVWRRTVDDVDRRVFPYWALKLVVRCSLR